MKQALAFVIATASLLISVTCVSARTSYTFNDHDGSHRWSVATNWTPNGVPGSNDSATIPVSLTCAVDANQDVSTVDVEGTLNINAESPPIVLTFHNVNGTNSTVNGSINMLASGLKLSELHFVNASHRVSGSGKITGMALGNKIVMGHFITLHNLLATTSQGVRGTMTIDASATLSPSPATFDNEGICESTGEIDLTANVALSDISGALWITSGANCPVMRFYHTAALYGDLTNTYQAAGLFDFEATVTTCGTWTWNGGEILVTPGASFDYVGFSAGTSPPANCTNNPAGGQSTLTCNGGTLTCFTLQSSVGSCNSCP